MQHIFTEARIHLFRRVMSNMLGCTSKNLIRHIVMPELAQSKLWPAGTLCITIAANIADTSILRFDACFPDSVIGFISDKQKADSQFIKYTFDARLKSKYLAFSQGVAQDNLKSRKTPVN